MIEIGPNLMQLLKDLGQDATAILAIIMMGYFLWKMADIT